MCRRDIAQEGGSSAKAGKESESNDEMQVLPEELFLRIRNPNRSNDHPKNVVKKERKRDPQEYQRFSIDHCF